MGMKKECETGPEYSNKYNKNKKTSKNYLRKKRYNQKHS